MEGITLDRNFPSQCTTEWVLDKKSMVATFLYHANMASTMQYTYISYYTSFRAIWENIARVRGCIFTSPKDEWKYSPHECNIPYCTRTSVIRDLSISMAHACSKRFNACKVPSQIAFGFLCRVFVLFIRSLSFSDSLESSSNHSCSETLLPTSAIASCRSSHGRYCACVLQHAIWENIAQLFYGTLILRIINSMVSSWVQLCHSQVLFNPKLYKKSCYWLLIINWQYTAISMR